MRWPLRNKPLLRAGSDNHRYLPVDKVFAASHIGGVVGKKQKCLASNLMRLTNPGWFWDNDCLRIYGTFTSAKRPRGSDLAWKSRIFLSMWEVWSVLTKAAEWDFICRHNEQSRTITGRHGVNANPLRRPFGGKPFGKVWNSGFGGVVENLKWRRRRGIKWWPENEGPNYLSKGGCFRRLIDNLWAHWRGNDDRPLLLSLEP